MSAPVPPRLTEDARRDDPVSHLSPSRVALLPVSYSHVTPPTARARPLALATVGPGVNESVLQGTTRLAPYFCKAGVFLTDLLCSFFAFVFLCLTLVTAFIFQYVMLLALWSLDSFKRPLHDLSKLVDTAREAGVDERAVANANVRAAWSPYTRSMIKDLQESTGVAKLVLPLSVGLLAIPSISPAGGTLAQTLAWFCMLASAAGLLVKFNMARHLNNIDQRDAAPFDWVYLAERYRDSHFATVPMLLAGPAAWSIWSAVSFVALLLDFVWRFRHTAVHAAIMHGNSTLPMLLFPTIDPGNSDPNSGTSTSGEIVYFSRAAQIVLAAEFIVALIHFLVNAFYFTRLGYPLTTTLDVELANTPPLQPNVTIPGSAGNVAVPPADPAPSMRFADNPAAATTPDDSDGSTPIGASQEGGTTDNPEDEDDGRVLAPLP